MKYLKAYFEAFGSLITVSGIVFLVMSSVFDTRIIPLYLLYLCVFVSFAGPVKALNQNKTL